jgi:hypothetical protein
MKMISIREMRGSELEKYAQDGELVGIKNYRELIGVLVPLTPAWMKHLIDDNRSRIEQNLGEAEEEMAAGKPMVTLEDLLLESSDSEDDTSTEQESFEPSLREPVAVGAVEHLSQTALAVPAAVLHMPAAMLKKLGELVGAVHETEGGPRPTMQTVRVGDLSGSVIQDAGAAGQSLALTHDRKLVGFVVPVTPQLIESLIEQNFSRILYNIDIAEKEIEQGQPFSTLDNVLSEPTDTTGN